MNHYDIHSFKCISPGDYDSTMQCVLCNYKFCESADASFTENTDRASHLCVPTYSKVEKLRAEFESKLKALCFEYRVLDNAAILTGVSLNSTNSIYKSVMNTILTGDK